MGTLAAPNLLITLTDFSSGAVDTGKSVEIVLHGDAYPGDAIALSEIGVTGKYKYETSVGVAAITQGVYEVYADAVFVALFQHGFSAVQDHMDSDSNPHSVVAAQISIADSGSLITATTVEAALQEIVTAVNTKASSGSTVLTNNSTQSVSSSKPTVTNLDADKVDGKHVGFGANQIPYLERDAREDMTLRLDAIPRDLTGKNADKLDGYHAGSSGGQIPILSANVEAGRIHTSLQNIAQGYADGQIPKLLASKGVTGLHTSLLDKEVGIGNLMIPRISTGAVAGYLSDTILGVVVGTGDDMIPLISTDGTPEAGKVHSSILAKSSDGSAGNLALIDDTDDPVAGAIHDTLLAKRSVLRSRRFQTNSGDSSSDNQVMCWGFKWAIGNDTETLEWTIAFPSTFVYDTLVPIIIPSFMGAKSCIGIPNSLDDFDNKASHAPIALAYGTSTTGFTLALQAQEGSNIGSAMYWAVAWVAIGVVSGSDI